MYGKVFESIYDGTLRINWQALVTFQQLIILADKDGIVDMTPHAIHGRTGIPLDIIEEGIKFLSEPDPHSRSNTEDGRRIVLLDEHRNWGWRLVNHAYYSRLRSIEEKREADKKRIADKRASQPIEIQDVSQSVADCSETSPGVAIVAPVDVAVTVTTGKPLQAPTEPVPGKDVSFSENKNPVVTTSNTRAREAKHVPESAATWTAYSDAYRRRYRVDPVRNAKVNAQLAQLVKRLGANEAPEVASWYVRHNGALYVRSKHAVDLLLRDCEGIRTEWATGRMVTDSQARQTDRKQNNLSVAEQLISEQRMKEAAGV